MVGIHVLRIILDQFQEDRCCTFGLCVHPINALLQPIVYCRGDTGQVEVSTRSSPFAAR